MLLEDLLGHLLALAGQTDAQGTAIVGVGLALDQGFALQAIEKTRYRGAGDTGLFGQRIRGKPFAGGIEQEQDDEAAFGQAMRGQ